MGTFSFPEGLAPEVYPLAWLVGAWHGEGVLAYPNIEHSAFTQDVNFTHDGGPYLTYTSTISLLDEEGNVGQLWHTESGYWRLAASPEPVAEAEGEPASSEGREVETHELEIVLSEPTGVVSVYLGEVTGPRIDVATDLMARTPTAPEMNAGKRMYGLVQSDLLWVWDLAAFGQPLQSYVSARLSRVE